MQEPMFRPTRLEAGPISERQIKLEEISNMKQKR